jgi:hypothetical protein
VAQPAPVQAVGDDCRVERGQAGDQREVAAHAMLVR